MLALVVSHRPADAHLKFNPLDTSRYIKIQPAVGSVRIAYSVGPGAKPALALRRKMDRDRNGVISEAEGKAYLDETAAAVGGSLLLVVDGVAVHPAFAERHIGLGSDRVAALPFAVDLIEVVPLSPLPEGSEHTLVLEDTTAFPDPGDVEIRVEEDVGVELVRTLLGGRPGGSLRNVVFASGGRAAPEINSEFFMEFRLPEMSDGDAGWAVPTVNPVAAAAALAYLIGVGAWGWRLARRGRSAGRARTKGD